MNDLLLYILAPAAISFLLQSALCRKVKHGILRHGALVLPMICAAFGVMALVEQGGGVFGGLGALAAVLWCVSASCAIFGYGAAWIAFFVMGRGKNRRREE